MHESSLNFLRCVRCDSKLELDVLKIDRSIEEGILECKTCTLCFPIIKKIPIIWDDFSKYIYERIILGGKLFYFESYYKIKKIYQGFII